MCYLNYRKRGESEIHQKVKTLQAGKPLEDLRLDLRPELGYSLTSQERQAPRQLAT